MTAIPHPRARRPLVRLATGATAALVAAATPTIAQAAPLPAQRAATYCTSARSPQLAARMSQDISNALAGRQDTVAFAISDVRTGVSCTDQATVHFDSASVVKATIMGAVLRRAEDENYRYLTDWEDQNLQEMITASDNTAATNLWNSLGMPRLEAFLKLAGMKDTRLGADGYWGLTQITAADELKMLDVFTDNPNVLSPAAKAYALGLMSQVEADQRWGTPFGAPATVVVHVKNGWLPRATHGWRVHSLGIFTGTDKNYRMAVLSQDNATEEYGIDTIQAIASVVHRDLNGTTGLPATTPHHGDGTAATETSDGSAPFEAVPH
ncbi:class A beta-lactamase-related serine hydrolase [Kitasatospora sp. RB6PN24]|uniref:serine hydrolase n=1 Tax=Kitasatospora humi TaxID=2893891 RepID=UPI001E572D17|nr:serine hydrolase [Kitasatospora humi]MCC9307939.1 class A beta-lactamase-related serine hydrolase [Kitasatospora humi]